MLSSVYQQASNDNAAGLAADPKNTLLWKMNRQRLDFEALRDSLLAVSGQLDPTMGGQELENEQSLNWTWKRPDGFDPTFFTVTVTLPLRWPFTAGPRVRSVTVTLRSVT